MAQLLKFQNRFIGKSSSMLGLYRWDKGLLINSNAQSIPCGSGSSLNFSNNQKLSFVAIVIPQLITTSASQQNIINRTTINASQVAYDFKLLTTATGVSPYFFKKESNSAQVAVGTTQEFPYGQAMHIVFTTSDYNVVTNGKFYVNGDLCSAKTTLVNTILSGSDTNSLNTSTNTIIGNFVPNLFNLNGIIYDLKVFNVDITQSDVSQMCYSDSVNVPQALIIQTREGTITTSSSSTSVSGVGTKFTLLRVGTAFYNTSNTFLGYVAAITNDTTLTLSTNAVSSNTGIAFKAGNMVANWTFNHKSGTSLTDYSPFGNNGTLTGFTNTSLGAPNQWKDKYGNSITS